MSYQIVLSNGSVLVNVADNFVDHTTSLALVGRNYPGYGTAVANNFIHLLENAANITANPPSKPLVGQLWYDTSVDKMKVFQTSGQWFALTTGVSSVLGVTGDITLATLTTGLAPLNSPSFTGTPVAPTPTNTNNSKQVATCDFVQTVAKNAVASGIVLSLFGKTGALDFKTMTDNGLAPINSPSFTGIPKAPTPATTLPPTTGQIATTDWVFAQVGALSTGVTSVLTFSGAITLDKLIGDKTTRTSQFLAPQDAAAFTGVCIVPTPALNTDGTPVNTKQIVNCDFLSTAISKAIPTARIKLTGPLTFYVSPTGNDGNTGTQTSPFKTMQHAHDLVMNNYDGMGNAFTIILSPGTHTTGLVQSCPLLGFPDGLTVQSITFGQGAPGQAITNVIVSTGAANCFTVNFGAKLTVNRLIVTASGSNDNLQQTGNCFTAAYNGYITLGPGMIFGAAGGGHILLQANGAASSTFPYTITGGASSHIWMGEGSVFTHQGWVGSGSATGHITVTITGNPTIGTFMNSGQGCWLNIVGVLYSGTTVGQKFVVSYGGLIGCNGAGIDYFPGTIAGQNISGYYV